METANIMLTGMMGAGKTTIGQKLAAKLEKAFVDLDDVIEKRAGASIQELFRCYGEAHFRDEENKALKDVLSQTNQVIATGGGVVIGEENRSLIQNHPTIWLALDSATAAKRLVFDGTRPLLKPTVTEGSSVSEGDRRQGMARWRQLEEERRWAYSLCDWVVDAARPEEAIIHEIVAWWQPYQGIDTGQGIKHRPWKVGHLRVDVPENPYLIHFGRGILSNLGERCRAELGLRQVIVVSNPTVFELYGDMATVSLDKAGLKRDVVLIPDGEEHKHLRTVESIYNAAFRAGLDRKSGIIALGGGVVGDVAGFAAATYMRGVRLVQVPTTLLAQVDSSVGGKVGVNHPQGKNLIGSFYQPNLVLADLETLGTLPERQFLTGMAEVLKYGLIADASLLDSLARYGNKDVPQATLTEWVERSCKLKARVVAKDTKEAGYREILNFGHTVGHAVEKVAGYGQYTHGEAVAIGMVTAGILSYLRGYLKKADCQKVIQLIKMWRLPVDIGELSISAIIEACRLDKKTRFGELRFVLLESLGSAKMGEVVGEKELVQAFQIQKEGGP
jgi:3-dehydroquinate synthase